MTASSNLTRLLRALAPVLLAGFFALAGSAGPGMAQDARTFAQAGAPTAPAPAARPAFLPPRTAAAPVAEQSGLLTGAWRWLFQKQAEFHRGLIDAVKGLKAGGAWSAAWTLALVSFGYGIFHAAGPGHGKAVVASYVLADGRTVRRGVALAFLAAFVQALSALAVVAVLIGVLGATGLQMKATERWLETISWGLVAGLGAWLVWRQVTPWLPARVAPHDHGHAHVHAHAHAHDHRHDHHGHAHAHADHGQGHAACETCGHAHMPDPAQLTGAEWSWRRALALAFSIGIRPCTGAILVLVFAIGQGLAWAGVFATFAMALGTAITVSALAALAVASRTLATRYAGAKDSGLGLRFENAARLAGAVAVFGLGLSFFIASLSGSGPI